MKTFEELKEQIRNDENLTVSKQSNGDVYVYGEGIISAGIESYPYTLLEFTKWKGYWQMNVWYNNTLMNPEPINCEEKGGFYV